MTCCARSWRAITLLVGRPLRCLAALCRSLDGRRPPPAHNPGNLGRSPGRGSGEGACRGCGRLPAGSRMARPRSGCGSGTRRRRAACRSRRSARPAAAAPLRGPPGGRRDPGHGHGRRRGGEHGRPPGRGQPAAGRPGRGPSLASLNAAIARGESFLDGLYKPLGRDGAVQSEYYGLPIRVRYPGYERWVLLGQVEGVACQAGDCPEPTRIRSLTSSYASEATS